MSWVGILTHPKMRWTSTIRLLIRGRWVLHSQYLESRRLRQWSSHNCLDGNLQLSRESLRSTYADADADAKCDANTKCDANAYAEADSDPAPAPNTASASLTPG